MEAPLVFHKARERLSQVLASLDSRLRELEDSDSKAEAQLLELERRAGVQAGKALKQLVLDADQILRSLGRRLRNYPNPLLPYTVFWIRDRIAALVHWVSRTAGHGIMLLIIIVALLAVAPALVVALVMSALAVGGLYITAGTAASFLTRQTGVSSLREAETLLDNWQKLKSLPGYSPLESEEDLKKLCRRLDSIDILLDRALPELRSLRRACADLETLEAGRHEEMLKKTNKQLYEQLTRLKEERSSLKRQLETARRIRSLAASLLQAVESELAHDPQRASQQYAQAVDLLTQTQPQDFKSLPQTAYIDPNNIGYETTLQIMETVRELAKARAEKHGAPPWEKVGKAQEIYKRALSQSETETVYIHLLEGQLQALSPAPQQPPLTPQTMETPAAHTVESILAKPLPSLKPLDWTHLQWKQTRLPPGLAPPGYEGEWRIALLGCGGWGCAYLAEREGERVVFKLPRTLRLDQDTLLNMPTVSETLVKKVVEQASIIKRLRHPHLLRLLEFSPTSPLMVLEFADGGTLQDQLQRGWKPTPGETVLVGLQLADALRYIHSRGLVHGDIKPSNIFVAQGIVKLGDFSSLVNLLSISGHSSMMVTPGWRAPEQVYSDLRQKAMERGMENRIDVYQLGNLLLFLTTGLSLDGERAVDKNLVQNMLDSVEDKGLRSLIADMIRVDPTQRPSAEMILSRLASLFPNTS